MAHEYMKNNGDGTFWVDAIRLTGGSDSPELKELQKAWDTSGFFETLTEYLESIAEDELVEMTRFFNEIKIDADFIQQNMGTFIVRWVLSYRIEEKYLTEFHLRFT